MITQWYDIFLDDKLIGTTELEKSDAPMGVVFGKIILCDISSGYEFFKSYCMTSGIEIINDYPVDRIIATTNIPNIKVIKRNGIEIKGQGISINGTDSDVFEITIFGVSYPFFEKEFPHHVKVYNNQFKEN